MADDTYPGIEIRVRTDRGELLNSRSDILHYELMQMWLENGFTGNEWYPLGGTVLRSVLIEIRAVDVPRSPLELELERELADCTAERCCVCGSLDVGYHNYRDQAFCWPCADGDGPPGHRPCCCHAGFSGDHVCCIHRVGVDGQAAELELATLLWRRGELGASLAELEPWMTAAQRAELDELTWRLTRLERRVQAAAGHAPAPPHAGGESVTTAPGPDRVSEPGRARLGSGLARIARRARFRSGRS